MIKKQLLILLILLSSLAGYSQTVTLQTRSVSGGLYSYFYPGKSPAGYDTVWNAQTIRNWTNITYLKITDTLSKVASRYWVEHQPHVYYGALTVTGTAGNSIVINGNSISNPNSLSSITMGNGIGFISPYGFTFSNGTVNGTIINPDGTIYNPIRGKYFLMEGDAPTIATTYTKTQVDSADNTRANKSITITGVDGISGGGDLSTNRTLSLESYATTYGLVPDSVTDNTAALATMKTAIGTNKIIYFNSSSAGHVYRFNSAVTFAGYTIKSDPGVIISQSSLTGTNLVGAHIITPTSFRARDAVQVSTMQQNANLPDFYPTLSGIDKTEQPTSLTSVLPSALTKTGYNVTSDTEIAGVGTATSLQYAQTSGLIAASAAPDSLTFDIVKIVTPRPGKEYTMSAGFQAGASGYATGGSSVAIVNFGTEWVALRVSGSKYYLDVKKSTLTYTETAITKVVSGAYLMGSGRNTLMSVRFTSNSTVEFYVNGLLITRYTSTGQVQTAGFGVNRTLNQSGATIAYGMAVWDIQRKQTQGVLKIAYFGDSIIAGELRDMSVSTQVKTGLVGQNGISNVIGTNYGVPSTKIADVATLMSTIDLTQYNYVIVQSGINDIVSQTSASSLSTNLNTIATLCASAGTRLILGVVPNAIDSASTHNGGFGVPNYDKGGYARGIIDTRAASNGALISDVNAELGEISIGNVQLPDNLHPSSFFANIMARGYIRAMLSDLQPLTIIENGGKIVQGKYITYGTAAPTTGYHVVNDEVINSATVAGGIYKWVCTTTGTPGTWSTMYLDPATTTGDIVYNSSAAVKARLAIGATGTVLHGGATPSYSKIAIATDVTPGTANQIVGTNSGATALEYKTVSGSAATGAVITHASGSITVSNDTTVIATKANTVTLAQLQTRFNNLIDNVTSKTANYTILTTDWAAGKTNVLRIFVDATGGNVTITLPTAATRLGYAIYVTKTDNSANTVSISPVLTLSTLVTQGDSKNFAPFGTTWYNQ